MNFKSSLCFVLLLCVGVFAGCRQRSANQVSEPDKPDRWEYAQLFFDYCYGVDPYEKTESGRQMWTWTDPDRQVKSEQLSGIARERFNHPEDQPIRSVIDVVNHAAAEGWQLINVSEHVKGYGELVDGEEISRWTFQRRLRP